MFAISKAKFSATRAKSASASGFPSRASITCGQLVKGVPCKTAGKEMYRSQQPRLPQAQAGPLRSMDTWPISGHWPLGPLNRRPPSTMPAPTSSSTRSSMKF